MRNFWIGSPARSAYGRWPKTVTFKNVTPVKETPLAHVFAAVRTSDGKPVTITIPKN